jgi:hypothetical protein
MPSIRHTTLIILGVLFAVYCLYQARFLILGPAVSFTSHTDGEVVSEPLITLSGTAWNTAWLSLNDRQIYTDEEGYWSEKLILSEGESIMKALVKDRFGRENQKTIRIIYAQE